MFQNWVLRKTLRPKRDEIPGQWKKLHNQELRDFHSSPNVIRVFKSELRDGWSTRHPLGTGEA
jgi:hypothetical protein